MNYFKEAILRWRGTTPPWFKKTQAICVALGAMGTTITGISIGSGKLSWITVLGAGLAGAGGIGGALCQFVVSVASIVLEPGDTVQNQASTPIPITVQASVQEVEVPPGVKIDPTTTDPPPQLP